MSPRAQQLVVWVRNERARRAVMSLPAANWVVRSCKDLAELCNLVHDEQATHLVYELIHGREHDLELLARAMGGRRTPIPTLLCVDLRRAAAQQVTAAVRHLPHAHLSLLCEERLESDLSALRGDALARSAVPRLMERLLPLAPADARDIVATAIIAGRRAISVGALAAWCGTPTRTLDDRLSRAGMVVARRLLGWMRSLHSLWDLDLLERSPKGTAAAVGYSGRDAWAKNVARQIGAYPHVVLRDVGFEGLLERAATEVFSRIRAPHS